MALQQWIDAPPIVILGVAISVYALLSLFATLTNIAFVLFVLLKNPRSPLNRIWGLVVLCLVVWGSSEFVMRVTADWNTADLARRIGGIGYCFIPSPFLHFCLTFTDRRKFLDRRWSFLVLYGPGVLASILLLSGWITKTTHLPWGFTPSPSVGYLPYSLWLEGFFLYGLYLTYLKFRRARMRRERYHSLFILLGVSIPLLLGSITGVVLPLLGIEAFRIAVVATTITAGIVTFAIVKFQLMSLTPETTASAVLNTMTDYLAVTDLDGNVVFMNESFRAVTSDHEQTIRRLNIKDFLEHHERILKIAKSLNSSVENSELVETRYSVSNGRSFPVLLSISPILDSKDLIGFVLLARDISERNRAEEELRRSESRFRSVWKNSDDAMRLTDDDGAIAAVNDSFCRLVGMSFEELAGEPVTVTYFGAKDKERMLENYRKRFAKRTIETRLEQRLTLRSGKVLYIQGTNSFVELEGGKALLLGIFRDITEQRKLQEELEETARKRTEDLKRFASSVQRAQEEERHRIARELHDDICQRLSAMKLSIGAFEDTVPRRKKIPTAKLRRVRREIDLLITEVRRISTNLRPAALDDLGLVVALQLLTKRFASERRIKIDFQTNGPSVLECDDDVEIALYRIAQEALSNIANHARASRATVELSHDTDRIALTLKDNGKGFHLEEILRDRDPGHRLGLINMKERSELLGGSFSVETSPRHGTAIRVEIPTRATATDGKE